MMIVKRKSKRNKKVCHKRKLKFANYINCLEATQFENKRHHLEKHKIDVVFKKIIKNS